MQETVCWCCNCELDQGKVLEGKKKKDPVEHARSKRGGDCTELMAKKNGRAGPPAGVTPQLQRCTNDIASLLSDLEPGTWNLNAAEDASRCRTALMKWEGPAAQLRQEPRCSLCRPKGILQKRKQTRWKPKRCLTTTRKKNNKWKENRKSFAALPYLYSWKCARNQWKANSFTPGL